MWAYMQASNDRLHIPVQEVTFDPELVFWLSAGIPSDIDTCRIIQQSCVGDNTQYGSVADCLSYTQKLPSQSCAESSSKASANSVNGYIT